ncbi:MAG: hypothetical protein L0G63_01985 [Psychrobacter sp.]|uniref:hypothetical protein n=1 Tax=Psychrobacter sp. TaxID=56811 RepID=UPI002649532E|nr:hypothetical protein [Psychrobacter sp.]MDN5619238.1 hypothetical protein [Psychrobacter sp.]
MSKLFLISVIATGCQSRFRNGMQFTDKPKQIEVDDNELAVLESDRHLQVKVLSEGADDVETGDNTVNVDHSASEDTLSDATNASDPAFIIVDELENEPTPTADTDTGTAATSEPVTSEAQSAKVPKAPADHLETIVEAIRGLNLDVTADKPTVYVLQELGLDVSAKERDAAWDVLAAEHAASND